MGANASSLQSNDVGSEFDDIPESCVALILSYLDPPEIAKMARINRTFRAASFADFIWIPKLPSNYPYILSKLSDQATGDSCKRGIFTSLCRPNPFDGGAKEIWIDKRTGGVCLAISSTAMAITGIDDRRYWNHIPTDESRFQTVAYVQQTWWLEVEGEVEFQFPRETYSLFFRLHLGKVGKRWRRSAEKDVHGWDVKPAEMKFRADDGQRASSRRMLGSLGKWVHYHVGDFSVDDPDAFTRITFSLTQIDCTHTKGGLSVDSVFICPSNVGTQLCNIEVCM